MGASGWSYFIEFSDDVGAALAALRRREFDAQFPPGSRARPKSIAAYVEACAEDGTHSILDMSRAETRAPSGGLGDFGAVFPVSRDEIRSICGTDKPTRRDVEAAAPKLMALRPRWQGSWVIVHDERGAPSEYYFTGFSGD